MHQTDGKVLILSDGKPGHLNQSLAFARLLGKPYEVRKVSLRSFFSKVLSYICDWIRFYTKKLFFIEGKICNFSGSNFSIVISTGSNTYYANRTLAKKLGAKSIALMLPRGYRLDFDLIIAQDHDHPPKKENIFNIPVNLSFPQTQEIVNRTQQRPCVAIIVGGPSRHFTMEPMIIEKYLDEIFQLFPDGDIIITSSPRTPSEIEKIIKNYEFRFQVIYSEYQINPVADFLAISDYVFVTEDSTSMISEAVTFGQACVEILPLSYSGSAKKIKEMIKNLENKGCLHLFNGSVGDSNNKIQLKNMIMQAINSTSCS